jgi:SAM-dependent methyltransferase
MAHDTIQKTSRVYGFLWNKSTDQTPKQEWHFSQMQAVIPRKIVTGALGIEIGSGCGYDTTLMAKQDPKTTIFSLDLSEGIYKTKQFTAHLGNVFAVQGSALQIPAREKKFDFAYSFGVLHHTPDPVRGLREIFRVLKPGAYAYLYLYEDHSDNPVKKWALGFVTLLRRFTVRFSTRNLLILSYVFSPLIVVLFSWPARLLSLVPLTRPIARKIPFNFGTHPWSVAADLYDRFSAPIEFRYSRKQMFDMLAACGFSDITITKIPDKAGLVGWGRKDA